MSLVKAFKKSLRAKILLGYLIIIGILMLVSLWVIFSTVAINRAVEDITIDSYRSLAAVHGMLSSLDKQNMAQSGMFIDEEFEDNEQIYWQADKSFRLSLAQAQNNITYPGESEALSEVSDQYDLYSRSMIKTRTYILSDKLAEAALEHRTASEAYAKITSALESLYSINQDYMEKSTDNAKTIAGRAITSAVAVSIIGLIIALYLGYTVSNIIIRPTKILTESAKKVALGELGTVADVGSEDEIGSLANEFNIMTKKLQGVRRGQH